MKLLLGQKDHVQKALPAGMGSLLGLSSFGNFQDDAKEALSKVTGSVAGTTAVAEKATSSTIQAAKGTSGYLKWLLPLLLAAILAYFLFTKGCKDTANDLSSTVNNTTESIGDAANDAGNSIADASKSLMESARAAFTNVNAEAKEALDKISFTANSAGKQMIDFIEGEREEAIFRFNNLTFETGSARLDPNSGIEIDNVAAIMKTYPDVNIEVQGHTDNTGNPDSNQQLSQARSESIKARLIAQGVAATRITTRGYGQESPIADNNTEEGRSQNRRIEIKIIT
jgi:outer membrane protein OmpA-like peptidoglycan-associated protein